MKLWNFCTDWFSKGSESQIFFVAILLLLSHEWVFSRDFTMTVVNGKVCKPCDLHKSCVTLKSTQVLDTSNKWTARQTVLARWPMLNFLEQKNSWNYDLFTHWTHGHHGWKTWWCMQVELMQVHLYNGVHYELEHQYQTSVHYDILFLGPKMNANPSWFILKWRLPFIKIKVFNPKSSEHEVLWQCIVNKKLFLFKSNPAWLKTKKHEVVETQWIIMIQEASTQTENWSSVIWMCVEKKFSLSHLIVTHIPSIHEWWISLLA